MRTVSQIEKETILCDQCGIEMEDSSAAYITFNEPSETQPSMASCENTWEPIGDYCPECARKLIRGIHLCLPIFQQKQDNDYEKETTKACERSYINGYQRWLDGLEE